VFNFSAGDRKCEKPYVFLQPQESLSRSEGHGKAHVNIDLDYSSQQFEGRSTGFL